MKKLLLTGIGWVFLLFGTGSHHATAQKTIGLCIGRDNPEGIAAVDFLRSTGQPYRVVSPDELSAAPGLAEKYGIIWLHLAVENDTGLVPAPALPGTLEDYLEKGGSLLLTQHAFPFINRLGIEDEPVEKLQKGSKDEGYGRQLGFHSFLSHSLFAGLHGGAYIFKPATDTVVTVYGFFGDRKPFGGKVIAVDWDYIFLREEKKMVLEYEHGPGKVLAVGGYVNFLPENINRLHLEQFMVNIFQYLSGKADDVADRHWNLDEPEISGFRQDAEEIALKGSSAWNLETSLPSLARSDAEGDYWDVAGERMLVMGRERSGIEEIWSHPFMACRDVEAGLLLPGDDSVTWLSTLTAGIRALPNAFVREYRVKGHTLTETVTASDKKPVAVVHYRFDSPEGGKLHFRFRTNMRIMWPYSHEVLGDLRHCFSPNLNAFVIKDQQELFCTVIGSPDTLRESVIGQYEKIRYFGEGNEPGTDEYIISGGCTADLPAGGAATFVIATSPEGVEDAVNFYREAVAGPESVFRGSEEYYENFNNRSLEVITPDKTLNEGLKWAIMATDQFFVTTPGIGSSFTAGYATTRKGWDGNHEVNGRPGYGWYFGRDAGWSGMGTLHYGDHEKIRATLGNFIRFQDLNGKIYHELSTSGFVHYDAADATPLFIVLAGRYLKHSGDVDFIATNWQAIRRAIDFCYSTDTDGDLLIENTNVGHGWVEGGFLFGSLTSLYLASCWAEALANAAYLAGSLGFTEEAARYASDAGKVISDITQNFWNDDTGFYNQGIYADGTYHTEPSILSAIPMLFGQSTGEQACSIAGSIAGFNYTSDWGCRITGMESERYNPRGYHTGSVWPLFTGWASLAEYRYGRPLQGFTHLVNNAGIYRHWGLGYLEEVLNGEFYSPAGVCHHQCWSQTMAIQPLVEGMLGFRPDAMDNSLSLSPHLPPQWDSLEVNRLRMGEHTLSFRMRREGGYVRYLFDHNGPGEVGLSFSPFFPPGTVIGEVKVNGVAEDDILVEPDIAYTRVFHKISLAGPVEISYETLGGISVVPVVPEPVPGDTTSVMKIISHRFEAGRYGITLEGIGGTQGEFDLWHQLNIKEYENCLLTGQIPGRASFRVDFEVKGITRKEAVIVIE